MMGPQRISLEPREVPLGGLRAMNVLRTLPSKQLPTVGAWCFLDRFGPGEARMRVEPHPHIGLQTVTWPLEGEIRHRDSVDSDVTLRRGQLDLMTAGRGISHSEYSVGEDPVPLDALQLWVVLPESAAHGEPAFEQHTDLPRVRLPALAKEPGRESTPAGDSTAVVVLGEFAGIHSPATTHTPIVGAEISVPAGSSIRLPLNAAWEHALLLIEGDAMDAEGPLTRDELLFLGDGRDEVVITSETGALLFLIGGEPFEEDLVMWWNFAARTHEEIEQARTDWEAGDGRFGHVVTHGDERVPAPELPHVRLMPRRRKI